MKRRAFISAGIGLGIVGVGSTVFGTRPLLSPGSGVLARGDDLGDGQRLYTGADLAFGTTISVQLVHADPTVATLAIEDALAAARKVDRLMTLHRPDSQVMQLNLTGVLANPDPELLAVLQFARQLSLATVGAFDITVQPLWQLYSAAAARGTLPDAAARRSAMAATGWQRMTVDARQVRLGPCMAITLNGIAQGHAVDLARQALAARGIEHALVDTGEFGALGEKHRHAPWRVGVRDPRDADGLVGVLPMDRRCVATSGDYETTFSADYLHHHIFDPATGDSPTQLASVTVLAPTGMQADGWSTACMVLGRERSIALAESLPELELMLVDKEGAVWHSARFPTLATQG